MENNAHVAVYEPGADSPFTVIYIQNVADPDSLIPILTPFLEAVSRERGGLEDVECLAAWLVRELIDKTGAREFRDVGICLKPHGKVDYHYAIKPDGNGGCRLEWRGGGSFEIKSP